MKKTILIFILTFNLISYAKANKNESVTNETELIKSKVAQENNEITIKYLIPIKGYNVSVKWLIRGKLQVRGSENFSGPAILTFENIDTKQISWVLHPEFTIDIDEENLKYITVADDEFVKNQSFTQISKYIMPKFKKVGTSEKDEEDLGYTYIPFFFQDINFDDKDELILTYATTYEKGGSQNKIFKIPNDDNLEFSEMTEEPFTNFSGFYYGNPSADAYNYTVINYKNKTITHHELSGAQGSGKIIYEFKKIDKNSQYKLFRKINVNNSESWDVEESTITKYDDYGEIIKVDKTKGKRTNE